MNRHKTIGAGQEGIALFIVLWVLVLLSVIAGQFCYSMRSEVHMTRNLKDGLQAYYIAEAGFNRTVYELLKPDTNKSEPDNEASEESQESVFRINTDNQQVPYANGSFKISLGNESGKIDLNSAGAKMLGIMLNAFNLDIQDKDVIIDSIQDWRDKDNLKRLNGAEDSYYESLDEPYGCKDGKFASVAELLLVKGVTSELFYGGLDAVATVYNNPNEGKDKTATGSRSSSRNQTSRININAAQEKMLLCLPLMDQALVDAITEFRSEKDFEKMSEFKEIVGPDVYKAVGPYITLTTSKYYSIEVSGSVNGTNSNAIIGSVIHLDSGSDKGYSILEWQDGRY